MEKKTTWQLFWAWLRGRLRSIGGIIHLMFNYVVVSALMHISLEGVWYSSYIGICVGLWLLVFDFRHYLKQYKAIYSTYESRQCSLCFLPPTRSLIEESYHEVIEAFYNDLRALKSKMHRQTKDANDYYTMWTHQIKTPIAAMHLILQKQKSNFQEAREREMVSQLEEELYRVDQYANMALQYLRLESMSQDLLLKSYELSDIVTEALKKLAVCFMNKKISISVESFSHQVVTDEKWLQFVIEQIISNSIKYTKVGGITIGMEAERLCISDTGIGIQKEDLPRIFERGFTGYNGRMDKKSTGIGLYLCKQVVSKLGHTVEVRSEVGVGTTFYIGFPSNEGLTLQD